MYVPCHDGNLYAFDRASGEPKWKAKLSAPLVTDACATYSPEQHENSLKAISGFCRQITTDQVLDELRSSGEAIGDHVDL